MPDRSLAIPRLRAAIQATAGRTDVVVAIAVTAFQVLPFANKYAAHLFAGRYYEHDFYSFYFAVDAAFNHGTSPYSLEVVRHYERAFDTVVYPFLYPPIALPWLFPLSLFGFNSAFLIFQAASAASLIALVIVLQRHVVARIEAPAWRFILIGALFAFEGIAATLVWAQINIVVVLLIMLAWAWSTRQGADRHVAFCLFAAAAIKTYPAVFLLIYLVRRRYAVVGWFALFALANLAVALLMVPIASWSDWMTNIVPTGGYGARPFGLFAASSIGNQNFNGLFMRLFDASEGARLFTTAAVLCTAALVAGAIIALRGSDDEAFYGFSYALVSPFLFLAAPLSWFHHFVFLLPALAYMAVRVGRRSGKPGALAAQAAFLVVLALCAYKWPAKDMESLVSPALRSVPTIAPVLLFMFVFSFAAAHAVELARAATAAGQAARVGGALKPAS